MLNFLGFCSKPRLPVPWYKKVAGHDQLADDILSCFDIVGQIQLAEYLDKGGLIVSSADAVSFFVTYMNRDKAPGHNLVKVEEQTDGDWTYVFWASPACPLSMAFQFHEEQFSLVFVVWDKAKDDGRPDEYENAAERLELVLVGYGDFIEQEGTENAENNKESKDTGTEAQGAEGRY